MAPNQHIVTSGRNPSFELSSAEGVPDPSDNSAQVPTIQRAHASEEYSEDVPPGLKAASTPATTPWISSLPSKCSGSERTPGGQRTDLGDGGGGSGLLVAAEGAEGLGGGGSGEEGKSSELHLSSYWATGGTIKVGRYGRRAWSGGKGANKRTRAAADVPPPLEALDTASCMRTQGRKCNFGKSAYFVAAHNWNVIITNVTCLRSWIIAQQRALADWTNKWTTAALPPVWCKSSGDQPWNSIGGLSTLGFGSTPLSLALL